MVYPIAEGSSPASRLTNWAVMVKVGEGNAPPPRREDWSRPGKREELMPHVERFTVPYVDVRSLIAATSDFYEYPCCDRDPAALLDLRPRHAARRRRASDVSGGIERRVAGHPRRARARRRAGACEHPRQALLAYEQKRLPMTADIVRANRRGGPEA